MEATATDTDLTRCARGCTGHLVYPYAWRDMDTDTDDDWWLELHCPECDHLRELYATHDTVERFDAALNAATDSLVEWCERLTTENMRDDVERFVAALAADAIQPCDFGWP